MGDELKQSYHYTSGNKYSEQNWSGFCAWVQMEDGCSRPLSALFSVINVLVSSALLKGKMAFQLQYSEKAASSTSFPTSGKPLKEMHTHVYLFVCLFVYLFKVCWGLKKYIHACELWNIALVDKLSLTATFVCFQKATPIPSSLQTSNSVFQQNRDPHF